MISVIIPAFNAEKTISQTIRSLVKQTEKNFEVIVVDDGSTDMTSKYAAQTLLPVQIIRQENQGAAAARNTGAQLAQGEYLLFCDADIVLHPTALETWLRTLEEHPEASYAYSAFTFGWKKFPVLTFDPDRLRHLPYIHTTSLIRRIDFPGFDPSLKRFQDWDLWLTMLEAGHMGVGVDAVLFAVTPGGTMSRWAPSWMVGSKFWSWVPAVRSYQKAKHILQIKHRLI